VIIHGGTFDEAGHVYKDVSGRRIPSATELMQSCGVGPDYSMVKPALMEAASDHGRQVHAACSLIASGTIVPEMYEFTPGVEPFAMAFSELWQAFGFERVINNEEPFIGSIDTMPVGCGPDLIVGKGKRLIVIDLKTPKTAHRSYGVQTAIYELAYRETFAEQMKGYTISRAIWRLDPSLRVPYRIEEYTGRADYACARAVVACGWWKLNNQNGRL
jgi:hypothetical protein